MLICDPGEACGAYPTLDQRVTIDLDRNRAGLDFETGFGGQLGAAAVGGPQGGYSRAVAGQAQEAEPTPAPRVLVVTPFGVVEGDEGPFKGLLPSQPGLRTR